MEPETGLPNCSDSMAESVGARRRRAPTRFVVRNEPQKHRDLRRTQNLVHDGCSTARRIGVDEDQLYLYFTRRL